MGRPHGTASFSARGGALQGLHIAEEAASI